MNEIVMEITPEMEGERIDKCISNYLESLSRSYIQKIIKDGKAYVNDAVVKANYKVKVDDKVQFEIPDCEEPDIPPQDIPLDILYEDKDILIVNKPKDMVVHPAPGHYEGHWSTRPDFIVRMNYHVLWSTQSWYCSSD